MNIKPIHLFWTGGWDSTFRLLQATIIEGRAVQPIYIISPERRSLHYELNAINRILNLLMERIDPSLIMVIVGCGYRPKLA